MNGDELRKTESETTSRILYKRDFECLESKEAKKFGSQIGSGDFGPSQNNEMSYNVVLNRKTILTKRRT